MSTSARTVYIRVKFFVAPHAATTLRNVTAIKKMAPGVMEASLAGVLLGPAQLFEDVCAYLSDASGFEVDKVSPVATTLTQLVIAY